MKIKNNVIALCTIVLLGCSKQNSTSSIMESTTSSTSLPTVSTSTSNTTEERSYGMTKLISLVIPNDWEIVPDGYDSPYISLNEDSIEIRKWDADIRITASLESYPVGIGGDSYTEGTYTYGDYSYEAIRNYSDDKTNLTLDGGGYLGSIFDDYGILSVQYTNPKGAYADDSDLTKILNTLNVKDNYGTVTILADKINIRSDVNDDSEKRGTVKKGQTYKVRAVQGDENYTWYAIGYTKGEPNGGSFDWIADKDGEWIEFVENEK